MNTVRPESLQKMYSRPKLIRYVSLMFLTMARDSIGDGMEILADSNGDIADGVWLLKDGERVEEWVHPDYCASGAINVLRREFSFERHADNTEHATWTILLANREVNVQVRLMSVAKGTLIALKQVDRLEPAEAEQVLSDWFPDNNLGSFLRAEPYA